ncbi:MAG: hypothetical protein ACLFUP_08250, partial [Desulfobacteraceae bacterium]
MSVISLEGVGANRTIERQTRIGQGDKNPFDTEAFQEANRLVLDLTYVFDAPDNAPIVRADIDALAPKALEIKQMLERGEGDIYDRGTAMIGWHDMPEKLDRSRLAEIRDAAGEFSSRIDAFVSIGIGGSYLGLESTFKALTHNCFNRLDRDDRGGAPEIHFLGQNMDPDYFRDTLDMLEGKRVGVNVISKSGTTTETAIAFRIIRRILEKSIGDKARTHIVVTTDPERGALREAALQEGYSTLEVPGDIGGRFSVLSDVGLFGLAVAGIDIEELTAGSRRMRRVCLSDDFWSNPALVHA